MGKNSRKVAKNNQKKQDMQKNTILMEVKKKIQGLQSSGQYDEALEHIIELLDTKNYDGDVLFKAADIYFMAGDYDRASVWVNNTLDFDPGHIGARILLARICMLQERTNEALEIMEFVLRTTKGTLQLEEREKAEEIMDYFRYTQDLGELAKTYPHAAAFMGIDIPTKSAENEVIPDFDIKGTNACEEEPLEESLRDDDPEPENKPVVIKEDILNKDISLQEKITLLNSFAGAYYYENKIDIAKEFLLEAKSMDCHNEETVKNLIILALDENDKALALEYAALISKVDFSLIKMIRDH